MSGSYAEGFVEIDDEGFYLIPHADRLGEFLMSIVSNSDHWLFVSSRGGLTAGRRDANAALFPYETVDRLHRVSGLTGPVTAFREATSGVLWEPFRRESPHRGVRNLYKSVVGDQIIFEERNDELGLVFRYRWSTSERFGFVRTSSLVNRTEEAVVVDAVDGLLNVLPAGLSPDLYRAKGVLTDAYKRSELIDRHNRLGVYSLEAEVSDRPEPAEVLLASVVWSAGLATASVGLDSDLLGSFRTGSSHDLSTLHTGRPGSYLLSGRIELAAKADETWMIVADVEQDQSRVAELHHFLGSASDPSEEVVASIRSATDSLVSKMARSDALQRTGDRVASASHYTKTTFNVMRGGIFTDLRTSDFLGFLASRNRRVADRHATFGSGLPESIDKHTLLRAAIRTGDAQLIRLALEYLPLTFSRRHGDPSRPWNEFAIRVLDEQGEPAIYYQGNWRDIFQNWEALGQSFPEYLSSMVAVFLNASTPDGFNPYRITSEGIDWEVPEPDDPWGNIGYWGDHQIVYLSRLLDKIHQYLPDDLAAMLDKSWFAYADVPYRIAPYEQIVAEPKSTIAFDRRAEDRSAERVETIGADGKLVPNDGGDVHLVTMIEKLLVPALSKLSNYVPGGGIWMNTQRPEWNDSNNALAGYGLSMVTLFYLRRYLDQLPSLLEAAGSGEIQMSTEVAEWLADVVAVFRDHAGVVGAALDDVRRREIVDQLGAAFNRYRRRIYDGGFSGFVTVNRAELLRLRDEALPHLDDTIKRSRRPDGLYHSYNLVRFEDGSASVEHLYEMLEGQVAALGSGLLTAAEQADLLDALFDSAMYREDQQSFMLYPVRRLPSFLEKNVIPAASIDGDALLRALVDSGDSSIVVIDSDGNYRFNSAMTHRSHLEAALDRLAEEESQSLVAHNRQSVLDIYEEVFQHHAFTGRSGTMYGYEGIGSVFWHMIGKLLVAVQEAAIRAQAEGAEPKTLRRLVDSYWRVRAGLGFNKTAAEYGAFPTDPYSHTPAHAGAKQPGMTGQVKEELLARMHEVGVRIEGGEIVFDSLLLRSEECLESAEAWPVIDLAGSRRVVDLEPGSLGLTLCQVPVVIQLRPGEGMIEIEFADGTTTQLVGRRIDRDTSRAIFLRSGDVATVRVQMPPAGE